MLLNFIPVFRNLRTANKKQKFNTTNKKSNPNTQKEPSFLLLWMHFRSSKSQLMIKFSENLPAKPILLYIIYIRECNLKIPNQTENPFSSKVSITIWRFFLKNWDCGNLQNRLLLWILPLINLFRNLKYAQVNLSTYSPHLSRSNRFY